MAEKESYFVRATVDRFEGKHAILKTDDKQEIKWLIKNLPDDIKEGSLVRLVVSTNRTEQVEREKLAKTLLNDILKGE
jgi:hypothetical protein